MMFIKHVAYYDFNQPCLALYYPILDYPANNVATRTTITTAITINILETPVLCSWNQSVFFFFLGSSAQTIKLPKNITRRNTKTGQHTINTKCCNSVWGPSPILGLGRFKMIPRVRIRHKWGQMLLNNLPLILLYCHSDSEQLSQTEFKKPILYLKNLEWKITLLSL